MNPIFAKGKTNEQSESGSVAAGVTVIPVADANSYFAVGQPIFISETDGTEVEYLGPAIAVSTSAVTVTHALQQAKGPGYKVWRPTDYVLMPYGISSPFDGTLALGVETQRSLGGEVYRTKTEDSYKQAVLTWDKLKALTWIIMRTFIVDVLNCGIYKCTIGYEDSTQLKIVSVTATLLMVEIPHLERTPGLVRGQVIFQVAEEDAYV